MKLFNRFAIAFLVGLLVIGTSSVSLAVAQTPNNVDQVRSKVNEIGTGKDAKVELELRDGTKVKGVIETSSSDSMSVTDEKTGSTRTIDFASVAKIKKPRKGLKTRTWVIIGAAAVAAIIVGKTVLYPVLCDGGAGC
jgi:hypothetical protein